MAVETALIGAPRHWGILRFKAVMARRDRRNVDLAQPMMSLTSAGHIVLRSSFGQRQQPAAESLPHYLCVEPGDLVVNPMWLIGGAVGVSAVHGAVSPDYRVFSSRGHIDPRYLHHLLRSRPYMDQYKLYTRAETTFDRRVQQPDLDNMPLAVPPLEEQQAIADYLDRETAKIDTMIAKQERLIESLRERRAALIAAAVLDHGSGHKVKHAADVTLGKMLDAGRTPRDGEVVTPYVRAADVLHDGSVNLADLNSMPFSASELARLDLRADDVLVIEGGATVGKAGHLGDDVRGISFQKTVNRVRAKHGNSGRFLFWSLAARYATGYYSSYYDTVSFLHLTAEKLKEIPLFLPPPDEQNRIARSLDRNTAGIDATIQRVDRFIGLSRERRAALITAAVTGQIDVREQAA